MDGLKGLGGREEEAAPEDAGDGFQVVLGKKKNRPIGQGGGNSGADAVSGSGSLRMATKDNVAAAPWTKAKVSFHDPSIPRPQDLYSIRANNSNEPFKHVWLLKSEDDPRPIHPLENLSVEQFIDRNVPESEPVKPADLDGTPFTLVEDKNGLAELAKKLKTVNEFAVDLEHNQYRSFQGLTCLMQISTRTEDFIIDTLKLRVLIGLYLKEHFQDPTKRKVMHGADRDIIWLQQDFHIYVCNLFDTGQASRVLDMERNSLEHLLHHFCGVTANKEYQKADWRLRPLSDEMIKYAREDTHYLLYIYDLMRMRLQRESTCEKDLLLEAQKRSNEICLQLYKKELLTDTSYLHIYGLQEHELNAKQLAVLCALHQWRDYMARQEDESTGYVLPNKTLIEIAKKMPTATEGLKRIVKSKHPFVEDNFDLIVGIIWNATGNSYAFESTAEQLKKERLEQLAKKSMQTTGEDTEMIPLDADSDEINFDPADRSFIVPLSMNQKLLNNNGHQQVVQATVQERNGSAAFGHESHIFGVPSNEQAASKLENVRSCLPSFYPQLPEYSSEIERAHNKPEGMQTSWSLCDYMQSLHLINQGNSGIGQPPDENKQESQDLKKRHFWVHSKVACGDNTSPRTSTETSRHCSTLFHFFPSSESSGSEESSDDGSNGDLFQYIPSSDAPPVSLITPNEDIAPSEFTPPVLPCLSQFDMFGSPYQVHPNTDHDAVRSIDADGSDGVASCSSSSGQSYNELDAVEVVYAQEGVFWEAMTAPVMGFASEEEEEELMTEGVILLGDDLKASKAIKLFDEAEASLSQVQSIMGQQVVAATTNQTSRMFLLNLPLLYLYKEKKDTLCPICKDGYEAVDRCVRLPCQHFFHMQCILQWLLLQNSCPVCRHELPSADAVRVNFQEF